MKRCWYVILAFFLFSCSPRALHEAQDVVSQADSLWQQGDMYRDSVSLAQAYCTLGNWKWFYADEYAHSCYHYGKLLRAQDDPVSAMQVFINATHTPTHDYHILGRVYNNMGDIVHRAGEYELSYKMFEQSARQYLQNGDTLIYYFCLNDMALELALLGHKDSAYTILAKIDQFAEDPYLRMKINETKAEACLCDNLYDSAIYYSSLIPNNYIEPTCLLIRAQSYSFLGEMDSSVYYANQVLAITDELFNQNNALYILTQNDTTKDINGVRETAADRSDTQKLIEIKHGKYAQAVQILEQDLQRKPDLKWLYAILTTLYIGSGVAFFYINSKRKRHHLLSQQIRALEVQTQQTIEQKRAQVESHCAIFLNSKELKKDLCWNDYGKMCDIVNQYFYLLAKKLQLDYSLSEREVRLCVLTLLDFGYDKMAEYLFYAPNGIGKFKMRVSQKLGTTAKNLHQFLIEIAVRN